jgi:hypothetical protein
MAEAVDVLVLIEEGKDPVFITSPTVLGGKELKAFLVARVILERQAASANAPITGFIGNTPISVNVFYFSDSGPVLIQFEIQAGRQAVTVEQLTGDPDLGQLFTSEDAFVRVFCCTEGSFGTLRCYAAELSDQQRRGDFDNAAPGA